MSTTLFFFGDHEKAWTEKPFRFVGSCEDGNISSQSDHSAMASEPRLTWCARPNARYSQRFHETHVKTGANRSDFVRPYGLKHALLAVLISVTVKQTTSNIYF